MIVDAIGKFIDGISKALHGEGFDSLIDLLNGGMMVGIGAGIMKFIKNLTGLQSTADDAVGGVGKVIKGFKEAINGVKETLEDFQASLRAGTLLKIAGAVGILAAALVAISLIDSDKLGGALASISILFAELAASMAVFDKTLSGKKGLGNIGISMIEMSVAILLLSSALKKISGIEPDKLKGALAGITVLMGEMTVASIALSKWGGKAKTSAIGMLALAETVNILAGVVRKLSELEPNKLANGLKGVGVLLGELSAFMIAAKFGNFKATQGLAIIELSAALLILEDAVSGFGKMDLEVIKQGLLSIGIILGEVATFALLSGQSKHILSSATALTIVGAAMLIFGKVIKDIGAIPGENIAKGLLGISGALAAVALAVNIMPKNMVGIGLGLIEVGAALKLIGSVIQDTGGMKWEEIGKGMTVLAGSMAILAVALNVMKGTLGGAAAMLVMSGALAIFTPVLKSFGSMSLKEIGMGLLALAGAFTVLGIAGAVLGPMIPAVLGLSAALALLGVGVAACGAGILAFSAGLASLAVSGVAGVTALVAAFEILIVGILGVIANSAKSIAGVVKTIILSLVDVIVECAPAIAEGVLRLIEEVLKSLSDHGPNIVIYLMDFLIGVINAIADRLPELIKVAVNLIGAFFKGVVDALNGIDTTTLMEGIVGIGLLSAIMLALSAVAGLIPGAMAGVLGMGAVIAEMSLVLAAVGAFAQLPGLKWLIGEGGELLQGVGVAIGKFAGGIVGGLMGGISSQFPQIGQDLSDFMANAQGFISGAKQIDPAMLQGVNSLAKTIVLLTAANILDGLSKWFTGGTSLVEFGKELAEFGPYFRKYANDVSGINPEVITASSNAALALAEMATKLPNSGGLAGKIFGENNLSVFGEELEKFGPHIKAYGDQVKGLDAEAVVASAQAAQMLSDMASTLPNSGGLAAKILGDNTLTAFGEELERFGPHISKYAQSVNGINPASVQASVQAAQMLSDMAATLPNSGGLAALILGDNTLSSFGEELEKFGPYIAKYSQDVAGVQPTVVTASANAAKALSELANNLPNSGGLVSWFTGDNDIGSFGQSLEQFGQSFARYYNSISGIDTGLLNGVVTELKKLVDLAAGIAGVDTSGMTRFANDLTTMAGNGIDGFIQAFTNANAKAQQGVNALIMSVISAVQTQANNLRNSGNIAGCSLVTGFSNGIVTKKEAALKTVISLCQAIIAKFRSELPDRIFNNIGENIVQALAEGIKNKRSSAEEAVRAICLAIENTFRDAVPAFEQAGTNAAAGFTTGLNSQRGAIIDAATEIADAAAAAMKKKLEINSPSRVFGRMGAYSGEGFVQALRSYSEKSAEAGLEVASGAMASMADAISRITNMVNSDIEYEPTIRPVMDLSNLHNGVQRINETFNRQYALAASMGYKPPEAPKINIGDEIVSKLNAANVKMLNEFMDVMNKAPVPVNVSVGLEGDSKDIFKVVRVENDKIVKATRYNPLSHLTNAQSRR